MYEMCQFGIPGARNMLDHICWQAEASGVCKSLAMGSGDCFPLLFSLALPEMSKWGISANLFCSVPGCKGRAFPPTLPFLPLTLLTFCLALGLKGVWEEEPKHQKRSEVIREFRQKLKQDYLEGGKTRAKLFSLPSFGNFINSIYTLKKQEPCKFLSTAQWVTNWGLWRFVSQGSCLVVRTQRYFERMHRLSVLLCNLGPLLGATTPSI